LVLVGRNRERAVAAAESLGSKYGASAVAVQGDASVSQTQVDRFIEEAVGALDSVDGLAVTTGTSTEYWRRSLEQMSDAAWAASFEDLLMGTVRPCMAVVPHLTRAGSGAIVTTAAYSVRAPDRAAVPYSTLKAAVAAFTKGLARSYGKEGIQANCVCPGAVETERLHQLRGHFAREKGVPYEEAFERVMVEDWELDIAWRPARPHEVGELIAFLLSQRARYLTGALVNIDGGTNF
jgi:NAD(P)-dependent dehydrogenase (short-subunit alcohol dehydrogenase family)